ncbi:MAG: hypothetical protein IJN42_03985 [Clostridia bacterium]|nr:hypothetical protein [Clostridia bacterium]
MNTFLAANSCNGFYSLFDQMTDRKDHNILLIKGGPGTGKSSLMRKVAEAAKTKGYTVEQMHCSSDPASLDGVFVPEKKLILLDATAPHCADPKYPGAVEQIIALGDYWDRDQLIPHRRKIIHLNRQISALFTRIYRLLGAVGELHRYADSLIAPVFQEDKAKKTLSNFFSKIAAVPQSKKATVNRRFLSAIGADGPVLYEDLFTTSQRVLMIEDNFESGYRVMALADELLERLGYDRLQALCPVHPERIDHLWVPELSLGILLKNSRLHWKSEMPVRKTITMRQLCDAKLLAPHKHKLQFIRKLCNSLYDEIAELMASEKALHDELEQIYIQAMDFDALNDKTEQLIAQIL